MAVKNICVEKKKEKSPYATYSTATPRAQNTAQNSAWNTVQSAAPVQSNAVQKAKREKTPSELGEEVVRIMLEDYAQEERQKQAAADRTAQYNGGAAKMKAAGNKEASLYRGAAPTPYTGNAADPSGGAASYSSLSAAKPAAGNQNATPHGGAAMARYSRPAAAVPAVQKREKTPSERGDEMVARMLVDEGLMDPKKLEEYLASFEEPSAQTFTEGVGRRDIIGPEAYAARNAAPGDGLSVAAGNASEDIDPTSGLPDWLPPWSMPDHYDPELAPAELKAGLWLGDQAKQLWDDTHVAPGRPVSAYLLDKVGNAMDTVLEGAWNGIVDFAQAGVNADLEQQAQQAQQFSFLGGPYQTYADQITDATRSIQEALPEAAEKLRSHRAAEQAPEIEILDREALPKKGNNDILNEKSDSKKYEQKEWWEKPGASEPIDPNDPAYQAKNAELTDKQRAAGLRVVKLNGNYYVDVTPMINTRLQEVEPNFRNHLIDFQNSSSHNEEFMLANTAWFISQVKGNGPWDIKVEKSWLQQFGDILELKDMSKTFAYNGQAVTPENLGNLTYGYLGRSMGWPAETLYLAGGIYNQLNLAAKKIVEAEKTPTREGRMDPALFYLYDILKPSVYSDGSYGDGENDYEFVKKGVELYEAVH